MEVRIFSSWIWPNFFAYILHETGTPTSAYHLSIFWSIIVDAEETSSVSNRRTHHKWWPKLPIFMLVTTRTLSPHQSSQGELLQPNFLISKMLLEEIRWSPPVIYETLQKKDGTFSISTDAAFLPLTVWILLSWWPPASPPWAIFCWWYCWCLRNPAFTSWGW